MKFGIDRLLTEPDLVLSTDHLDAETCVERIIALLEERGVFGAK